MADLPPAYHLSEPGPLLDRIIRIRREIWTTLHDRAVHPEAVRRDLTRLPHPQISLEEYELYWSYGDRQRLPPRPVRDAVGTTTGAEGSHMRRECSDIANIALCCMYLAGFSTVTLPKLLGYHIALDIIDGVRARLDSSGFVNEHSGIPALTDGRCLTPEQVAELRQVATGKKPDGVDGLGHFVSGQMLLSLANRALIAEDLHRQKVSLKSADAQRALTAWPVIGLELDAASLAAAAALQAEFRKRHQQAAETQERYRHARRASPDSGRYV